MRWFLSLPQKGFEDFELRSLQHSIRAQFLYLLEFDSDLIGYSFLCLPQGLGALDRFVSNSSVTNICLSFKASLSLSLALAFTASFSSSLFFCSSFLHSTSYTVHTLPSFFQLVPFYSLSYCMNFVIFLIEILIQTESQQ